MMWFIPVMKKLNPGWDGKWATGLSKDPMNGLTTIAVGFGFDVSPVRALGVDAVRLNNTLVCDLTPLAKSKVQVVQLVSSNHVPALRDLSPLAGLPLKALDLSAAPDIADLSPLAGMKLESISLHPHSGVTDIKVLLDMPITSLALPVALTDLRPLKSMKLKSLTCSATDLAPLTGLPLESLSIRASRPVDFSPLAGMKLKDFTCSSSYGGGWFRTHYAPDEKLFRSMPLETINGTPATQFWAARDAEKKTLAEFVNATAKLTPEKAVEAVKEALKKNAVDLTDSRIEGGAVVEVKLVYKAEGPYDRLAPLKALSGLKKCTSLPFLDFQDEWPDPSPVMNLPIEEMVLSPRMTAGNTIILRQMPTLKTINGKPAKEVLNAVK